LARERLFFREAIGSFAPGQSLRAALLLTYSFDGKWIEEGFVPDLFDRSIATALVIRDANRILKEAPTVRYHRANAGFSKRVFHPKLGLFVAEDRALAIIGSANLTRGGLERNLELGSAFEISPEGGPRALFDGILSYIGGPLLNELETRGSAAASLRDTAVALREVLAGIPPAAEAAHRFFHNYERPLWEQILEALPHRHIKRLGIVSPFFEPNGAEPEDPISEPDVGLFQRTFADLTFEPLSGEKPVSIFFQQSEGKTLLPIDKLARWKDKLALFQRLATSNDPRPLHGKFLLIEGARGRNRDSYLVAIHGSPNYTTAAFLSRPPDGNAEIAVLTRLPAKRDGFARIQAILNLPQLFGAVSDWSTLTHLAEERPPPRSPEAFRVTDATFSVNDGKLKLSWDGITAGAVSARVLIETNGAWVVVASGSVGGEKHLVLAVPNLMETDQHKLPSLKATSVRVELVDAQGVVIGSAVAPVNVDCPQEFCGSVLVGSVISTLDERIALAGCGTPLTYRQQLEYIERQRSRDGNPGQPAVITHQADLDRFFRNLRSGFRGMRARLSAFPNSEFTTRRTLKEFAHWCQDAVKTEDGPLSTECRMFLMDRLLREMRGVVETCLQKKALAPKLAAMAHDLQLTETLASAFESLSSLSNPQLQPYVEGTMHVLATVRKLLEDAEAA
jgi:hypothetical protein